MAVAADLVDLRSDTVTRPSAEMRRAMADADVGDDVYGEDPSVAELESEVAAMFGRGAAMYVPSGTMGNQIAVRLLVPSGDELLCDADAHVVSYEGGGLAQHGGIQSRTIVMPRGLLSRAAVDEQLRTEASYHTVPTRAVAVEQSHNRGGGAVYPLEVLKDLRATTTSHGVALHCDGARIWNAHVATGVELTSYGALFDTMSVCLSKGLGAPVGSVVVLADAELLAPARVLRRRLGGGMRQAGILAAAGLYALRHNIDRLADDHARAARLAEALADISPGVVSPKDVETNIVIVDLSSKALDSATVAAQCRADGVLVSAFGPRHVRLVTHLDLDDADITRAIDALRRVLGP